MHLVELNYDFIFFASIRLTPRHVHFLYPHKEDLYKLIPQGKEKEAKEQRIFTTQTAINLRK